tara:strand:+ start:113 stop:436 length:324 start_codon:yes stop_codon:yes gene_type:complete
MEFNLEETLSNTPSNTYELIFSVGDGFLTFNHLSVLEAKNKKFNTEILEVGGDYKATFNIETNKFIDFYLRAYNAWKEHTENNSQNDHKKFIANEVITIYNSIINES